MDMTTGVPVDFRQHEVTLRMETRVENGRRELIEKNLHSWLPCGAELSALGCLSTFFFFLNMFKRFNLQVQWLRCCTPNARGPGLILCQGARSHMCQLKMPCATAKTWCSQIINKCFRETKHVSLTVKMHHYILLRKNPLPIKHSCSIALLLHCCEKMCQYQ